MKKIIIPLCVVIAVFGIAGGALAYQFFTGPKWALYSMVKDVQEHGTESLEEYLEGDAKDVYELVTGVANNGIVSSLLSMAGGNEEIQEFAGVLSEGISEIKWEVEDILKSKNNAEVILGFRYQESISGRLNLHMNKKSGEWKITNISIRDFYSGE